MGFKRSEALKKKKEKWAAGRSSTAAGEGRGAEPTARRRWILGVGFVCRLLIKKSGLIVFKVYFSRS